MYTNHTPNSFKNLGAPRKIWAIPSIHADVQRLKCLHSAILDRIQPGDKVIYLGNYTGYGTDAIACINEIIFFNTQLTTQAGVSQEDIIYLRGRQEDLWEKILQLHINNDPSSALIWMLGQGLAPTLNAYGICPHDGINVCRYGMIAITRWLGTVRQAVRAHAGHEKFALSQIRAAYTDERVSEAPVLFVHAGLNIDKPLHEQGEHLWWSSESFASISKPYSPFQRVVRGYDPRHKGIDTNPLATTIDGGCGFGGPLICSEFNGQGGVENFYEV